MLSAFAPVYERWARDELSEAPSPKDQPVLLEWRRLGERDLNSLLAGRPSLLCWLVRYLGYDFLDAALPRTTTPEFVLVGIVGVSLGSDELAVEGLCYQPKE
jgi:hypothetical protein